MRISRRGAALAVVVAALLLYLMVPLRTYLQQREALAALERQTELLDRDNARLEARVRQLHDPAYLERLARECLGMARPGEIAFVVVPEDGPAPVPAC